MSYQVTGTGVTARPTAVIPAATTWQEFPSLWPELLGEVWACLHAGGIHRGCRTEDPAAPTAATAHVVKLVPARLPAGDRRRPAY